MAFHQSEHVRTAGEKVWWGAADIMADSSISSTGHNASLQHDVHINPDPALDVSNEHHHEHLHHNAFAEKGHHDEPAYSTGTTLEPSAIPDQESRTHGYAENKHRLKGDTGKGEARVVDTEKGRAPTPTDPEQNEDVSKGKAAQYYAKYRIVVHLIILLFFTGWWIASLILHRHDKNWVIPFLLWLAISLRIIFFHVPVTIISRPMAWTWRNTGTRVYEMVPEKLRVPLGALIALAVILIG